MIKHLLLDLDNTLYPASGGMDEAITRRMIEFISSYLNIPFEEAVTLRNARVPLFGTTLEWLTAEHNLVDSEAYFQAVHPENEIEDLQKDDRLRPYLLSLGLPMTLLTNAPKAHAQRLMKFFNIEDIFIGVFDLNFHNGVGKPHRDCFLSTLSAVGYSVEETLFVDDHPKYVRGYKDLGGRAVIVDENGKNVEMAQTEGFAHIGSIYDLGALLKSGKLRTGLL